MGERSGASGDHAHSFGPFRILPERQLLLEGGTPVRLGSRAFAILVTLVERAGEVVSKEELMARVSMHSVEKSRLVPEPDLYSFSAAAELNPLKLGSRRAALCAKLKLIPQILVVDLVVILHFLRFDDGAEQSCTAIG